MTWYALQIKSQTEFMTERKLSDLYHEDNVFLPVEHRTVRRSRRSKKMTIRTLPMIRGYIFIRFPGLVPWSEILSLSVVIGVVSAGSFVLSINEATMDRLRGMSGQDVDNLSPFKPGDKVLVRDMNNLAVDVTHVDGDRAKILFQFLGREMETVVGTDKLELIE